MILLSVILVLGGLAPGAWKRHRLRERHRRLAGQLRQSVQNMAHALRVGVSFLQALEHAAARAPEPIASEWRRLLQSVRLGKALPEALPELLERIPMREMEYFVAAVRVALATGGSLAGVLETLGETLQARESLRDKMAALTAPGKASGILLCLLPFVVLSALAFIIPEMVGPLFTTWRGQGLLAAILALIGAGGFFIYRIVNVEVSDGSVSGALPEAIDLLVIAMQAGLDFQSALRDYLEHGPATPLRSELERMQAEWRTGVPRVEALRRLARRAADTALQETVCSIIQAVEIGSSLTSVLRAQAATLRQRRRHEAERQAALAPLKLMFPLFAFIFPTFLLALVGPVALRAASGGWLP